MQRIQKRSKRTLVTHFRFPRLLNQHNKLKNPEMTLVTFKVMKMASLTRVRFGYFPTKYVHVLSKQSNIFRHKQKVLFHISSWLNVQGQEIKMPSLSPTMTEGKIVKWLKKEGDSVSPGDVLCDIETDKAVVSMETEEEGILAKIVIPENTSEIKVGSLIAMMVAEGEDWKSVELPSGSGSSSKASSGDSSGSQAEEIPNTTGPPTIQVKMPSLSPTMTSGTIVKWLKKEGDPIAPGDVLCDIQTDKAVMSMETEEEGILAKILAPDDSKDVNVGTLIALIVAEGEDWKSVVVPSVKPSKSAKEQAAVTQPAAPGKSVATKSYGPAVRSLIEMYQLEPGTIKATGRNNKLLKEDVLKYIAENKLQKKPPKSVPPPSSSKSAPEPAPSKPSKKPTVSSRRGPKYVDIELTNIRKVIAKRLTQSKQEIPHSYGNVTCNVDKLLELRRQFLDDGGKASVNDFIIKAVAFALQECPKINANYVNNDVKLLNNIDISVAVATDNGLITPIIKSANTKDIAGISQEVKELAGRARKGSLKPEEFQGGTFTISNLGMFGVAHFSAIINPPQCAILAVGGSTQRLGSDLRTYNDVRLTLSYDRRAIQEDEAAEFLESLRNVIENPKRLLSDNKQKSAVRL